MGDQYLGYQRQPNGQTIENYIELAFIKSHHIKSLSANGYQGASRTDAGVNAYGNVFIINLERPPNLQRINHFLPRSIIIWSYAKVKDKFSPRKNDGKLYRYYLPKNSLLESKLKLLYQFEGEHDFTPFIKNHGAGKDNPHSTIYSIDIADKSSFYQIDIIGNKFGREQIRMMIGFIINTESSISPHEVLSQSVLPEIRAAPPHFLWLVSINFEENIAWNNNPNLKYKITDITSRMEDKWEKIKNYLIGLNVMTDLLS